MNSRPSTATGLAGLAAGWNGSDRRSGRALWMVGVMTGGARRLFMLVALAVVLGMYPASAVPASADGIEVLSEQQRINFPHDVVFELTARADLAIVEVRIDYRAGGSRVWSYGYPEFAPGRRIAATYQIGADGAEYLPPGTLLEYYYTVRDAQGGEHRTPTKIFEYTDPRFQWEATQVGPLKLLHHDIRRSSVDRVAAEVELSLERISDLLEVGLDRPVRGLIYNSRNEAEAAFPSQSRTTTEQRVFQGFAFPPNGVFIGIGLEVNLIVHESAHLLMHQAMSSAPGDLPSWLDEGFASYMEPGSTPYSGQSLSALGTPLRSMSTVSGDPHAIRTFYLKAESVVAYLIEQHGDRRFRQFIGEYAAGGGVNRALLTTYGFDLDGLEARWASSTAGVTAAPSGRDVAPLPSPLVYFDTWLIGGLALLALAAALVRFAWRKLRPSREYEDYGDYAGDEDYWDYEEGPEPRERRDR